MGRFERNGLGKKRMGREERKDIQGREGKTKEGGK